MSHCRVFAIVGAIGIAALVFGFRPFYFLFYAVVAAIAIAPLWARVQTSGIRSDIRHYSQFPQAGDPFPIEISLIERSGRPHWGLRVSIDDSASDSRRGRVHSTTVDLASHSASWWSVVLARRPRGMNQVGPLLIDGSDPLGFSRHHRRIGLPTRMLIYPRVVPVNDTVADGARLGNDKGDLSPQPQGISSVALLREYTSGDPFSRIHWPTTARMGTLMTADREDDGTENAVWVALDLDGGVQAGSGYESTEEYGITLAASLAVAFLDADVPVGLFARGASRIEFLPERGAQQRERILETLALARATGRMPVGRLLTDLRERAAIGTHLFVVTPSVVQSAVAALDSFTGTGADVTLLALDGPSFSERGRLGAPNRSWEQSAGVLVRRGDDLSDVLGAAMRSLYTTSTVAG